MLKNWHKRLIIYAIAFMVSAFIWYVNASWGNWFMTCFILSTTTFLIIITPFEIYFAFRDLWFDRWIPLNPPGINRDKVQIQVEGGYLSAYLIKPHIKLENLDKNAIVIIIHGFSDTKESLEYYYLPMVLQGYTILAYDSRGIGESKNAGKRSQFLKRIDDFENVLAWIKNNNELNKMDIYCSGFSIGALTVLCGAMEKKEVKKIIAISSISNYNENLINHNPIVKISYFIKGVKTLPEEINKKISPYFLMNKLKKQYSKEEWKKFSERILLIHAENDKIIKFKNFLQNKEQLSSPEENFIVLKKGGHSMKKNELALVGSSLRFLDN